MKQNQNFNHLPPFFAIAAALLILSACDDNTSSQTDRARETQTSSEQSEVQKYNAYVEVANSVHRPYAEDLATYQRYIQPVLDGKEENDDLLFPSSSTMSRVKENLDKARAMKPDMAELDVSAQTYSDALDKAIPLDRDLDNYIEAKTYLSDKGAHGREIQPAYISAMETLAKAQMNYARAIEAKDRARIKLEFDETEKDTLAYFRIGMVYHIKDSIDQASSFLNGEGFGDSKTCSRLRSTRSPPWRQAMIARCGTKTARVARPSCPMPMPISPWAGRSSTGPKTARMKRTSSKAPSSS